jgi:hypothetical protein
LEALRAKMARNIEREDPAGAAVVEGETGFAIRS